MTLMPSFASVVANSTVSALTAAFEDAYCQKFGPAWLAGALAWAAHVLLDRAAGYGLRDRTGFIRAH